MTSVARLSRGLVVALLSATAPGCARTPPPQWSPQAHVLCQGRVCYRIGALATGWRIVHAEGAEIGFYSDETGGIIQSNATCRDDAEAAPLESLTDHLLVGYTERHRVTREQVQLDGREALHSVYKAKLDGIPLILDLYVMKRNGCIFDLSHVASPDGYRAGAGDFSRFVAGFADHRKRT